MEASTIWSFTKNLAQIGFELVFLCYAAIYSKYRIFKSNLAWAGFL